MMKCKRHLWGAAASAGVVLGLLPNVTWHCPIEWGAHSDNICNRSSISSPIGAWWLKQQFHCLITLGERRRKCFSLLLILLTSYTFCSPGHMSLWSYRSVQIKKAEGKELNHPPKAVFYTKAQKRLQVCQRNSPLTEWEVRLRLWNSNYKSQLFSCGQELRGHCQ